MPYIGTQPLTGQFKKLDAITVVNGQDDYTMQYNGSNYKPATANALLVSVNGVIQAAGDAYDINGSTITFTENLVTGDTIDFIIALGDTGSAVTPVDGSVTTAKLANDAVTRAKMADDLSGTNLAIDTTSSTFKMTDLTSNAFYRTGTWSPVLSSTTATDLNATIFTGTLQTQSGLYTRVGDLVTASCHIVMPSSSFSFTNGGASSQHLSVTALPFKIKNDSSYYPVANIGYASGLSAWDGSGYGYSWHGLGFAAQKYFAIYYPTAGNMNSVTTAHITTNTTIIAQITYETDEA